MPGEETDPTVGPLGSGDDVSVVSTGPGIGASLRLSVGATALPLLSVATEAVAGAVLTTLEVLLVCWRTGWLETGWTVPGWMPEEDVDALAGWGLEIVCGDGAAIGVAVESLDPVVAEGPDDGAAPADGAGAPAEPAVWTEFVAGAGAEAGDVAGAEAPESAAGTASPAELPAVAPGLDGLVGELGVEAPFELEGGGALASDPPGLVVASVAEDVGPETELVEAELATGAACAWSMGALGEEFVAAVPEEPSVGVEAAEVVVAPGEDEAVGEVWPVWPDVPAPAICGDKPRVSGIAGEGVTGTGGALLGVAAAEGVEGAEVAGVGPDGIGGGGGAVLTTTGAAARAWARALTAGWLGDGVREPLTWGATTEY